MGIKFLKDQKKYIVQFSKRHPVTNKPESITRLCFKDANGIKQPIITKSQANKVFRELVIEMEEKITRTKIPLWKNVLADFKPNYLKTGVTLKTVETYSICLIKHTAHWNELGCEKITDTMIRDLISSMQDSSESHKKNILKFVRRVFQYAVEKGYIHRNPTPNLKFKIGHKNAKVLKENEASNLLALAKTQNSEWYYHWAIALFTGLRNGELYALRWDHIDFESNKIHVSSSWNNKDGFKSTKSGDERLVEIAPNLAKILKELKLTKHHPEFVLPRLREWDKGEQARCLRAFLMGMGLSPIRFHDLRATWATMLLNNGLEPIKVMAMGGWKDIKTMMIYARKAGVELKGCTQSLKFHDPSELSGKVLKMEPRISL